MKNKAPWFDLWLDYVREHYPQLQCNPLRRQLYNTDCEAKQQAVAMIELVKAKQKLSQMERRRKLAASLIVAAFQIRACNTQDPQPEQSASAQAFGSRSPRYASRIANPSN